ncbi:MAG TPA: CinA family protein [Casimicrobiaceae bacterium]|jgi:nicotinamide-nucleotide amidase|nr:CinA family protein [Casimicrobiaceae bacterium]
MRIDDELFGLAVALGRAAMAKRVMIATAESCTGGLLAGAITAVAGSSDWFERGFVTYSNASKIEQLTVPMQLIERFGAVSEEVARAMVEGALRASAAQWAIAVTGIAGPSGGTAEKPVGTVYFAWAGPGGTASERRLIRGDRASIRRDSVGVALQGLVDRLTYAKRRRLSGT